MLYAVRTRKLRFLFLAVGFHWLVDFSSVMLIAKFGILVTETTVGLMAVAALVWIIRSRKLFSINKLNKENEINEI